MRFALTASLDVNCNVVTTANFIVDNIAFDATAGNAFDVG
jgi:hypothetical protein